MSAAGHAVVNPLIKEARDRQRRRQRALGGAALAIVLALAAFGIVARGSAPGRPPGNAAAAGAPSGHKTNRFATAQEFAKYRLSCWELRRASIPVGPQPSPYCKPDSPAPFVSVRVVPFTGGSRACKKSQSTYTCPAAELSPSGRA